MDTPGTELPTPAAPTGDEGGTVDREVDDFSFLVRDVNHDGVLSEDEFDEGRSLFDKMADPDRFERYDVNGDGSITREEYMAGRDRDRVKEEDEALRQAAEQAARFEGMA